MNRKRFLKERKAYALSLGLLNVELIEQELTKNLQAQAKTKRAIQNLVEDYCKIVQAYQPENE